MAGDDQAASRAPAPRRNSSSRRRSACMSVMRQLFLTSNWRWTWWTSISCDRTVEYSRRSRCSSSSCRIARWRSRAICRDVKYLSASGTHSIRAARSTEGPFCITTYYQVLVPSLYRRCRSFLQLSHLCSGVGRKNTQSAVLSDCWRIVALL